MFEKFGEILTVGDLIVILKTSKNTIYNLLSSGEITGKKMGKKWIIKRVDLVDFVNCKCPSKTTTNNETELYSYL